MGVGFYTFGGYIAYVWELVVLMFRVRFLTFKGLDFLRLGVSSCYVQGLDFLRLGVSNSYVRGLDFLRLGVSSSYVQG